MVTRTMNYFEVTDNRTGECRYFVNSDSNVQLMKMLMEDDNYTVVEKNQRLSMKDIDFIRYAMEEEVMKKGE